MYIGNTKYKVYVGDNQGKLLSPQDFELLGYTQCSYIENTSNAYINTDFAPNLSTTRCICGMCPMNSADSAFFGTRKSYNYYLFYRVENNYFWPLSKCESIQGILTIGNRYECDWDKGRFTVFGHDGVFQEGIRISSSLNTDDKMFIFNFSNLDSRTAKAKLFYFKIYDNDVLVRDYIPVFRNSDNKYGLWDKVNSTFNISPNGTDFTGG